MNKWARPFEWNSASAASAGRPSTAPVTQYFAFLSYSHLDKADADWLHSQLERFRVPSTLAGKLTANGVIPSRLTPVFRDRHELAASHDLGTEIREALEASHCLIVLCSPAAAKSQWTNAEIELFKRLHPDGCVIAAIVSGEPFASDIKGREKEECLPPALRQKYDRRGRPTARRAEPLAADLRENGDGRRLGFLKIVAGMLGVGLDDLVQRDQLRRQRRLATITAASLAAMIVAIVLAVTAIEARDEARDQRREAIGMAGFMLNDLRRELEPIGKLDALEAVGARAHEYFAKQDKKDLSDDALVQWSRALTLLGEIASARGDFNLASARFQQATAGTAEIVRRSPDNPSRLFDHAQNVFWMGAIAGHRGDHSKALANYQEYQRLADRMVALEPNNMKWRMEVQYAATNVGMVFFEQRRFAEAGRQFESALHTIRALASADAQNAEYQKSYSESLAWLADARAAEGRLDEAIALREQQIALLKRLIRDGGGDVAYRQKAIPAHQALGRLQAASGRADLGIGNLRTAVDLAERLIPLEPANTTWRDFAAGARLALAEHLIPTDPREAAEQARIGCDEVNRLVTRDRSVVAWRTLLLQCFSTRALLALAGGSYEEAVTITRRALALAPLKAENEANAYAVARLHRLNGDAHQLLRDTDAAQSAWRAGLALLPRDVSERPSEMSERAKLLQRVGHGIEARRITARLAAIGYRDPLHSIEVRIAA